MNPEPLPPPLKPGQVAVRAIGTDKPALLLVTKKALSPYNAECLRKSLQDYLDSSDKRIAIVEGVEMDIFQLIDNKWVLLKEVCDESEPSDSR